MTTLHQRGRPDCGFVARSGTKIRFAPRSRVGTFSGLVYILGTCVWEDQSYTHRVVSVALSSPASKQKITSNEGSHVRVRNLVPPCAMRPRFASVEDMRIHESQTKKKKKAHKRIKIKRALPTETHVWANVGQ